MPLPGEEHNFLQIYFMGNDDLEVDRRNRIVPHTDRRILMDLMLHEHNEYVRTFKTALQRMPSNEMKLMIHSEKTPQGEHKRRYNAPTINEVAIIITNEKIQCSVVHNVHMLLHLHEYVRLYGSLDILSAYKYENFMQFL